MSNYKHYVFNNHPLLSIGLMNGRHPFERKRRVIVFLITLAFAMFVSFLLLKTDVVVEVRLFVSCMIKHVMMLTMCRVDADRRLSIRLQRAVRRPQLDFFFQWR
jgi:hypothetical protein